MAVGEGYVHGHGDIAQPGETEVVVAFAPDDFGQGGCYGGDQGASFTGNQGAQDQQGPQAGFPVAGVGFFAVVLGGGGNNLARSRLG